MNTLKLIIENDNEIYYQSVELLRINKILLNMELICFLLTATGNTWFLVLLIALVGTVSIIATQIELNHRRHKRIIAYLSKFK